MSLKRKSCDGLDKVNCDQLKIQKTIITSDASVRQDVNFPDTSGTIALTTDIPSISNLVTTDTTQTITGEKKFTNTTSFVTQGFLGGEGAIQIVSNSNPLLHAELSYTGNVFSPLFLLPVDAGGPEPLVSDNSVSVLTNKKLISNSCIFADTTDQTKRIRFDSSGQVANSLATFRSGTGTFTYQFPNRNDTMVSRGGAESITSKTFLASRIGTNGTALSMLIQGSFTYSGAIPGGAQYSIGDITLPVGFTTLPSVSLCAVTPSGGPGNWDRVLLVVNGANFTTTNVSVLATNFGGGATSGTATILFTITGV